MKTTLLSSPKATFHSTAYRGSTNITPDRLDPRLRGDDEGFIGPRTFPCRFNEKPAGDDMGFHSPRLPRAGLMKPAGDDTLGWAFLLFCMFLCPVAFAEVDQVTIPVTVRIKPVFIVKAESSAGLPSVELGPMIPELDIPPAILQIAIYTNTRDRYRIFHEWEPPRNIASGELLPGGEIQMRATPGQKGGASLTAAQQPLSQGRQLVFESLGGPDIFQIEYSAANDQVYEAGLYDGRVRLTVEHG